MALVSPVRVMSASDAQRLDGIEQRARMLKVHGYGRMSRSSGKLSLVMPYRRHDRLPPAQRMMALLARINAHRRGA